MEVVDAMYRVIFDEDARRELIRRAHDPKTAPRTRDRLEMLRLSDAGWSIPKIGRHLRQHEQTVRHWIKVFLLEGFDALVDPPRPGKPSAITSEILSQVRHWIQKGDRIWSAGQIAEEVAHVYGIRRSVDQWRRLLRRERLAYKRTSRHLKHKQDPEQVTQKKEQLEALQKRGTRERSTCAPRMKRALR
jgi:transposase